MQEQPTLSNTVLDKFLRKTQVFQAYITLLTVIYSQGNRAGLERASSCVFIASFVTFVASLLILFKLLMMT